MVSATVPANRANSGIFRCGTSPLRLAGFLGVDRRSVGATNPAISCPSRERSNRLRSRLALSSGAKFNPRLIETNSRGVRDFLRSGRKTNQSCGSRSLATCGMPCSVAVLPQRCKKRFSPRANKTVCGSEFAMTPAPARGSTLSLLKPHGVIWRISPDLHF